MRAGWITLLLATCMAGACGEAAPRAAASADRAGADSASAGPADPAAQLAIALRVGPRAALELLLRWDTAGLRYQPPWLDALGELYCFERAPACAGDEPAWDFAVAVRGYQVEALHESADSAAFAVLFDEIGVIWPEGMEEAAASPARVVTFARIAGAWRIVGAESQLPPHLSVAAVARRYRGVHPDSAVIVRWLRERA